MALLLLLRVFFSLQLYYYGIEMRYLTTTCLLVLLVTLSVTTGQAASLSNLTINAVILSKSNCRFTNPPTATLDFGNLDPASGAPVATSAGLTIRCGGSANPATFLISDDDGLNSSGPGARRMQHSTLPGNFIPYSMNYTPAAGTIPKNTNTPVTVNASILGPDYQSVPSGPYTDTVTLTITP